MPDIPLHYSGSVYDRESLRAICEMHETDFADAFDMERVSVEQRAPDDFYLFRDNGASILAVAHLDTVGEHADRTCRFVETEGGEVIFSRALDDRLGAYVLLDMLPKLGIEVDLLLTVGEENGCSTAGFFEPPKEYHWMIEFDRGGTDVVMYQYEDLYTRQLVRDVGARVGDGSFSDISYLEHLEIKGFNWGVGYQDYHGPRAHAFLEDTFRSVDRFVNFHAEHADTYMPHDNTARYWSRRHWYYSDGDDWPGTDKDSDEHPMTVAEAAAALEAEVVADLEVEAESNAFPDWSPPVPRGQNRGW